MIDKMIDKIVVDGVTYVRESKEKHIQKRTIFNCNVCGILMVAEGMRRKVISPAAGEFGGDGSFSISGHPICLNKYVSTC